MPAQFSKSNMIGLTLLLLLLDDLDLLGQGVHSLLDAVSGLGGYAIDVIWSLAFLSGQVQELRDFFRLLSAIDVLLVGQNEQENTWIRTNARMRTSPLQH